MTTSQQPPASAPAAEEEFPLQAQLGPQWALAPRHLLVLSFWCLFFLLLNYLPLRVTDLWGHVAYGNWILEHGSLPQQDPFAPLAEGMRVVDNAWLAQVAFAAVRDWGGDEALSHLFAVLMFAAFALISRTVFLQTQRMSIGFVGAVAALAIGWSRTATIRPECFGFFACAFVLWQLARHGHLESQPPPAPSGEPRDPPAAPAPWTLWLGVPLAMCLWANCHGSFVCGLAILFCVAAGRGWEAARSGGWRRLASDSPLRQQLWLFQAAAVATLVNPYGLDLWLATLSFAGNTNLRDVAEWQSLNLLGLGGREFAVSWIALTVIYRHSRRRIAVSEVLLLGLFGFATARQLRMINWYAAVYVIALAPHLAEIWNRLGPAPEGRPVVEPSESPFQLRKGRSWTYSLVALLLFWITFSLAPIGRPVVGDQPRPPERLHDSMTPLGLTAFLREHPPEGQLYNPQWWGDWLVWDGPPTLRPFMTTNIHLVPTQVWQDYRRLLTAGPGWQSILDRYRVTTVVVDKERQTALARALRRSSQWESKFDDAQAAVYQRKEDVAGDNNNDNNNDNGDNDNGDNERTESAGGEAS